MKFRKKPIVIEATQYTHPGCECRGVEYEPETDFTSRPFVTTVHLQKCYIEPGDWIIPEPDGVHYYPCKPDIFAATYEPAQ